MSYAHAHQTEHGHNSAGILRTMFPRKGSVFMHIPNHCAPSPAAHAPHAGPPVALTGFLHGPGKLASPGSPAWKSAMMQQGIASTSKSLKPEQPVSRQGAGGPLGGFVLTSNTCSHSCTVGTVRPITNAVHTSAWLTSAQWPCIRRSHRAQRTTPCPCWAAVRWQHWCESWVRVFVSDPCNMHARSNCSRSPDDTHHTCNLCTYHYHTCCIWT